MGHAGLSWREYRAWRQKQRAQEVDNLTGELQRHAKIHTLQNDIVETAVEEAKTTKQKQVDQSRQHQISPDQILENDLAAAKQAPSLPDGTGKAKQNVPDQKISLIPPKLDSKIPRKKAA
jgi:hypothetical protein